MKKKWKIQDTNDLQKTTVPPYLNQQNPKNNFQHLFFFFLTFSEHFNQIPSSPLLIIVGKLCTNTSPIHYLDQLTSISFSALSVPLDCPSFFFSALNIVCVCLTFFFLAHILLVILKTYYFLLLLLLLDKLQNAIFVNITQLYLCLFSGSFSFFLISSGVVTWIFLWWFFFFFCVCWCCFWSRFLKKLRFQLGQIVSRTKWGCITFYLIEWRQSRLSSIHFGSTPFSHLELDWKPVII